MKLISTHLKNMKVILDGIEWICDDVEVLQTLYLESSYFATSLVFFN
jgi:hypothetical protein